MATGKFVSYLRVSTEKQGCSGLGLEAQRQAVTDFLNGGCWQLVQEYVEVESGKRADRPKLAEALHHAKVTGNPNGAAPLRRAGNGNAAAITVVHENSNRFAADIMPVIEAIRADGVTSLYGIARELNYRGIKTMRGGIWHPTTVKLLLARAA